jgi:riboflavin kinase/FMN adenylyltransferase
VADRADILQRAGADHVVVLPTSPTLLHLTPDGFFRQVLCERLQAKVVVEGHNFCFGRDRAGTVATLEALASAAGLKVVLVPPVVMQEQPVSSSRVRRALVEGNVRQASAFLGRPYHVAGTVGRGQRRGQALGFPTANLEDIPTLIPGNGVYAVRVRHAERTYGGAANVGPNPTFGEDARKVEVHLLDFQGDLYGQALRVEFLERLRDIRTFAGAAELQDQLRRDVTAARKLTD